jgi:homogentisate 1,2-dioxygenase
MIHYAKLGRIAKRAHQILRDNDHLVAEHVFTREGFADLYSILYQKRAPTHETAIRRAQFADGFDPAPHAGVGVPERMHFRSNAIAFSSGRGFFESRKILLQNQDCTVGVVHASEQQQTFFVNGDADEMFFVADGKGSVETMFGVLDYVAHDYVVIPRGVPYRFRFSGKQRFLSVEAFRGFGIPKEFLNHRGQLKLDAPYNERDFRIPDRLFVADADLQAKPEIIVCRNRTLSVHTYTEWPYDVIGWDGFVYPFALSVHDYKPKTSTYHLPPTSHCVFEARGFVVMNFVPRIVDYGFEAIPCPYPHSSIDCDEVLYYADGDFTSRKGIEQYSLSFHPAGIPHGPHPERYEQSIGVNRTNELAIMVDTFAPLAVAPQAQSCFDPNYHLSWNTREHL